MRNPWSDQELQTTVADYFEMLRLELSGRQYSKAEHRRRLIPKLDKRSESSVEKKHQNISAVLENLGLPYISGYKPLGNFQQALAPVVEDYVEKNAALFRRQ